MARAVTLGRISWQYTQKQHDTPAREEVVQYDEPRSHTVVTNPGSDGGTQASQAGKRPASVSFTRGRRFGRIEDHFGGTLAPRACPE
jgi:hypothetical protein